MSQSGEHITKDGYNLSTLYLVHKKGEYSDEPDEHIGHEERLYDDSGKMVTIQRKTEGFITSEKRLDENGEFKEIEYTDEEHALIMRGYLGYTKNFTRNDKKRWDKNQEQRTKLKEVKDIYYYKNDLQHEKNELTSQMLEEEIGERSELSNKVREVNRKLDAIEVDPKHDDISPIYLSDIEIINRTIYREYTANRKSPYGKTIPKDKMDEFTRMLDETQKGLLNKYRRIEEKVTNDIEKGDIKTTAIKGDLTQELIISYNDNQVRTNKDIMRLEVKTKESRLDESDAEMILQDNEKYYDVDHDMDRTGDSPQTIKYRLEEKYGLSDDTKKYHADKTERLSKNMDSKEYKDAMKEYVTYLQLDNKMNVREKKFYDSIEHYENVSRSGIYKTNRENLAMFKAREGNEVLTPLAEK